MGIGRFKEAVSDVAETIRRAFQNPASYSVSVQLSVPDSSFVSVLTTRSLEADYRFSPQLGKAEWIDSVALVSEAMTFDPSLQSEDAWARWAAGAVVCQMPVFQSGGCSRLEVPPLPRRANARRVELPPFRASARLMWDPIRSQGYRTQATRISAPSAHQALHRVLGLPIAVTGQDLQKLPKALSMRYTLQLVKSTGENIRNLEVLGVFQIPVKGVGSLRFDGKTGRVLLELLPEALGAKRAPFILARKKNDLSFVSCFVEA